MCETHFYKEVSFVRDSNTIVPIGITSSLLKDDRGNDYGVVSVFSDLTEIKKRLGKHCLSLQIPIGKETAFKEVVNLLNPEELEKLSEPDKTRAQELRKELIEAVAESDDALLEKYLEGEQLSSEVVNQALRQAVLAKKIIPVFCGAATQEIGVKELLTGIVNFLGSPKERGKIEGEDPKTKQAKEIEIGTNSSFSAQVFKTILDPYVGQLTLFKVFIQLMCCFILIFRYTPFFFNRSL